MLKQVPAVRRREGDLTHDKRLALAPRLRGAAWRGCWLRRCCWRRLRRQPARRRADADDPSTASDETEAPQARAHPAWSWRVGYFEQGQTDVALDELKQVIAADPTFPDAYNLRGLIYMRLDDSAQAEESFRRALALNPRDANAHAQLRLAAVPAAAATTRPHALFEQALAQPAVRATAPRRCMAQGLCQARAGQRAEAERSLARSYELDRGQPDHRLQPGRRCCTSAASYQRARSSTSAA